MKMNSHRLFELFGIAVFGAYAGLLAWRLFGIIETPSNALILFLAAFIGYCLADIISGLVHWFADTYFHDETPILGPNFVKPFRFHHVDPKEITTHDFVEVNGNNSIVSFWVLMWAFHGRDASLGDSTDIFWMGLALFSMLGILATNQFHKWAHTDEVTMPVRWLQNLGLILSADHHAVHHVRPHDEYYCITVGWFDWTFKKLRFFRGLEWFFNRILRLSITAPDRKPSSGRS